MFCLMPWYKQKYLYLFTTGDSECMSLHIEDNGCCLVCSMSQNHFSPFKKERLCFGMKKNCTGAKQELSESPCLHQDTTPALLLMIAMTGCGSV